jgi:CBS domain-containing protein
MNMKVAELMTRNVASCRANESLSAACKVMWDCDCGTVPVVSENEDRVIGVITDRDICMCCWMAGAGPQDLTIRQAMSRTLHTCSADASVAEAERIMRANQIRRLPITDRDGRLVGILSLADIAREAARPGGGRDHDLAPQELTATLANIVRSATESARPH